MRIVAAVSGGGRTLANLLAKQADCGIEIAGVVSSSHSCRANTLACDHRLPLLVLDYLNGDATSRHGIVMDFLRGVECDFVALCGYLKPWPIDKSWQDKVINIHPALLPKFGGKGMYGDKVHQAVLEQGDSFTGATVHVVTDVYDDGPILAQIKVPVMNDDDVDSLASRVFQAECEVYPNVIRELSSGHSVANLAERPLEYEFSVS